MPSFNGLYFMLIIVSGCVISSGVSFYGISVSRRAVDDFEFCSREGFDDGDDFFYGIRPVIVDVVQLVSLAVLYVGLYPYPVCGTDVGKDFLYCDKMQGYPVVMPDHVGV